MKSLNSGEPDDSGEITPLVDSLDPERDVSPNFSPVSSGGIEIDLADLADSLDPRHLEVVRVYADALGRGVPPPTHDEIAAKLDCSTRTVERYLSAIRKILPRP